MEDIKKLLSDTNKNNFVFKHDNPEEFKKIEKQFKSRRNRYFRNKRLSNFEILDPEVKSQELSNSETFKEKIDQSIIDLSEISKNIPTDTVKLSNESEESIDSSNYDRSKEENHSLEEQIKILTIKVTELSENNESLKEENINLITKNKKFNSNLIDPMSAKSKKSVNFKENEEKELLLKTKAINTIIGKLKLLCDKGGIFKGEEIYNIWNRIMILSKNSPSPEEQLEMNSALDFLLLAIKVATKRGAFEFEECLELGNCFKLFQS